MNIINPKSNLTSMNNLELSEFINTVYQTLILSPESIQLTAMEKIFLESGGLGDQAEGTLAKSLYLGRLTWMSNPNSSDNFLVRSTDTSAKRLSDDADVIIRYDGSTVRVYQQFGYKHLLFHHIEYTTSAPNPSTRSGLVFQGVKIDW